MTARSFTTPAGVEIAYEELGAGGTPLVLVHGWTGTRRTIASPGPCRRWTVTGASGSASRSRPPIPMAATDSLFGLFGTGVPVWSSFH